MRVRAAADARSIEYAAGVPFVPLRNTKSEEAPPPGGASAMCGVFA